MRACVCVCECVCVFVFFVFFEGREEMERDWKIDRGKRVIARLCVCECACVGKEGACVNVCGCRVGGGIE